MSVSSQRIPERLQGPIGFLSLLVSIGGFVFGYVLVLLGLTLYFDMNGFGSDVTGVESLMILGAGIVVVVVGYLGWRGFMRYSY